MVIFLYQMIIFRDRSNCYIDNLMKIYLSEHFHQKIRQHAVVYKVILYYWCCSAKAINKQGSRSRNGNFWLLWTLIF